MPDIHAYLANNCPTKPFRASAAWNRIQDKPTSVTVLRGNETLAAQTVRLEYRAMPGEAAGGAGLASVRRVVVFGVRDHATAANTDLKKGDRFVLNGSQEYRVIDVVVYPGELQATAERSL